MPQLVFGGILAVIMLGLYIYSISTAVGVAAECGDNAACAKQLSSNISLLLNLVGGLISATVVGVLGATPRGELPAQESFERNLNGSVPSGNNPGGIISKIAGLMPSVFILVWIICGIYILAYGFITYYHDPVPALTAHAKTWIGTAIGAVYAYMGINPDSSQTR